MFDSIRKSFIVTGREAGERLDLALSEYMKEHTRSEIKRWIEKGSVTVAGAVKKGAYKVKAGEVINLKIGAPQEISARPQKMDLDIVFEDSDLIVINKPAGLVVHPAAGNPDGTLVNALLAHCGDLSGIGGSLRPGIVHRLDKGTSGLIIIAKNDIAHHSLTAQFNGRLVKKTYIALIYGVPRAKNGRFDQAIGRHPTERKKMSIASRCGRDSITDWELVESFGKYASLVNVGLVTGRTHQIRVHFSANGMPLIGDSVYAGRKAPKRVPEGKFREIIETAERPMLHSVSIEFAHPRSGKKLSFKTEPPDDFRIILDELRLIFSSL